MRKEDRNLKSALKDVKKNAIFRQAERVVSNGEQPLKRQRYSTKKSLNERGKPTSWNSPGLENIEFSFEESVGPQQMFNSWHRPVSQHVHTPDNNSSTLTFIGNKS